MGTLTAFNLRVPVGHAEAGTCRLVGTDPDKIVQETERLLRDPDEYARRSALRNPYGDGHGPQRIAQIFSESGG